MTPRHFTITHHRDRIEIIYPGGVTAMMLLMDESLRSSIMVLTAEFRLPVYVMSHEGGPVVLASGCQSSTPDDFVSTDWNEVED